MPSLLVPFCAWLGVLVSSWAQSQPKPAWNLLLVSIDTVRADHLGSYGYRSVTPSLDRLAGEGVVFEHVYTSVPLTLPAHASLLTGRYPTATGVHDNGEVLPSSVPTLAEQMRDRGFETAAFVGAFILDRRFGLSRGFDEYWGDFPLHRHAGDDPSTIQIRGDQVQTAAAEWIASHADGRFFAFVHFYDLHGPYLLPAAWRTRFTGRIYDGELAFVDDQIGKLWDGLARKGLADRTVLVITADHGEGLGDHGEENHGFLLYGSTTSIPLIIRLPGRRYAGKRVSSIARLIDIAPTACAMLGVTPSAPFEGRSLVPEMQGQQRPGLTAYSETLYPYRHFHTAPLYALRDSRYTFIETPHAELYEYRSDPQELHDQSRNRQAIGNTLREELDNLMASTAEQPQNATASPGVVEELRSLGYVGSASLSSGHPTYDSTLPDAKDRIALYREFQRALELEMRGDVRSSALGLERIASRDPALVIVQVEAGLARQKIHDDELAAVHFAAALKADSQNALAHFDLGVSLGNLGRLPAAVRELELATKLQPSNSRAFTVLGITRARQGELAAAIEAFNRALAIDAEDFDALLNRGNVRLMAKEWDKGAADLDRAVELEPRNATIHQALGTMYFYRGDTVAALDQYRQSLALAPGSSTVHSNLGLLYHKTGRNSEASSEFRRALTLDPKNQEAQEGLQEVTEASK